MSEPERPTCATCPYWDRHFSDENTGDCKRFPPRFPSTIEQIKMNGGDSPEIESPFDGWFPIVVDSEWCGEHPDFPAHVVALKNRPAPGGGGEFRRHSRQGGDDLR